MRKFTKLYGREVLDQLAVVLDNARTCHVACAMWHVHVPVMDPTVHVHVHGMDPTCNHSSASTSSMEVMAAVSNAPRSAQVRRHGFLCG